MSNLIKEAKIVKKNGKYCVVGHKKNKIGKYKNFGCYDTKEEAKKRLSQIYFFKHKGNEIIDELHKISKILYDKGIFHIADALVCCINSIIQNDPNDFIAIKLGKIITLIQKKGEYNISENLEILLPDILLLEKVPYNNKIISESKYIISYKRAYNIVKLLNKKYLEGEFDKNDFEYKKMKELEALFNFNIKKE